MTPDRIYHSPVLGIDAMRVTAEKRAEAYELTSVDDPLPHIVRRDSENHSLAAGTRITRVAQETTDDD